MRVEYSIRCDNKVIGLDEEMCGAMGFTTPRKEIEGELSNILLISEMGNKYSQLIQDRIGELTNSFIKSYAWFLGILSYYEETEKMYFQECFERLDQYGQRTLAEELYKRINNLECIKQNPEKLQDIVIDLCIKGLNM